VAKPAAKSTVDPRLAAMYKEVTQLVGIEKANTQLISMMSLAQGDEASTKMKIVSDPCKGSAPSVFKYSTFNFLSTILTTYFIQNILILLKKLSIYLKYII
jgi:hypothetical protein